MELGVEAMLQMPERIHKTIAEQSSLVNMPRIGSHRNQYFNTIQVNLASASPKVASKFISLLLYTLSLILFFIALSENLGTHFGALHMDLDDASFCKSLLEQCQTLLVSIGENWKETTTTYTTSACISTSHYFYPLISYSHHRSTSPGGMST